MNRIRPGRLLLTVFILGFTVFFGLDLATRGTAHVAGPADAAGKPAAVAHQPQARPVNAGTTSQGSSAAANNPAQAAGGGQVSLPAGQTGAESQLSQQVVVKRSFMNQLSNRTGDALQKGARALIGFIVSIFDSIIN